MVGRGAIARLKAMLGIPSAENGSTEPRSAAPDPSSEVRTKLKLNARVRPAGSTSDKEWTALCKTPGSVVVPEGQELSLEAIDPAFSDAMLKLLARDFVDGGTRAQNAPFSHCFGDASLKRMALDFAGANLARLDLEGTSVRDAGLAHLAGLTNLMELSLVRTRVTDAGLVHLAGLTNLRSLSLSLTKVTDAGLAHLAGLTNLTKLDLGGTGVTDAGLAHLAGLTNLTWLSVISTKTSAGLAAALSKSGDAASLLAATDPASVLAAQRAKQ